MDGFSRNALGEFKRKASLVDQKLSKEAKEAAAQEYLRKRDGGSQESGDFNPSQLMSAEAKIAASISRGELENLKGQGKPLQNLGQVGSVEVNWSEIVPMSP